VGEEEEDVRPKRQRRLPHYVEDDSDNEVMDDEAFDKWFGTFLLNDDAGGEEEDVKKGEEEEFSYFASCYDEVT